ncbi:MAG: Gfo/Idh/MocA family protein [Thermoplasmata archaeon]
MKVVIVGCKGFGKEHAKIYEKLGIDFSIVERDKEAVGYCTSNFKVSKVYDSFEDSLKDDAEIFDIIVPNGLHKQFATAAMRMGKHVLLEKPISIDVDSGIDIIRASEENKVKFMVAEQYYFDPSVNEALRRIKNGEIGKVHTIIVRHQSFMMAKGWKKDSNLMGRGVLIDEGTHFIDTFLNFGGDYNSLRSFVHSTGQANGEDTIESIFTFQNGAHGIFFYSWHYPFQPKIPDFEILGNDGSIYEDVETKPLEEEWAERKRKTGYGDLIVNGKHVAVDASDIIEKEIGGFIDSVETGSNVPVPPEIALRDLITIDRIYKASEF